MTTNDNTRSAIEQDLGLAVDAERRNSVMPVQASRTDVRRMAEDIREHTDEIMSRSGTEGFVQRVLDHFAPSTTRTIQQRTDRELLKTRLEAQVTMAQEIYSATIQEVATMANTVVKAVQLQASEDIAARGIAAATHVGDMIAQSGEAFDHSIDKMVATASDLTSATARGARADRIARQITMRAAVEEEAMNNICDAVRGVRKDRS